MGPVVEVTKRFTFDAAHHLPDLPRDHKCHRMHGHTYGVTVCVAGPIDARTGFVAGLDFADLESEYLETVHSMLDHRTLNDVPGLHQPTCERLSWWIFYALFPRFQGALEWVRVEESSTTSSTFWGESGEAQP